VTLIQTSSLRSSRTWRTFLSNHVDGIAAIDLFVLPTIAFQILYCLVIVRHGRRLWVSFAVTANPTAEWKISRQVTEAFPWDRAPRYLIRDRDTSYMVQSFCSGSAQWAFGTIRSHPDRPGKMLTLSDSSARSAANVSTTWSFLAKRTCAGSFADMPPIMRICRLL
jgi:hypothetical protein